MIGLSQQKMLDDIDYECNGRVQNKTNHGLAVATIDGRVY